MARMCNEEFSRLKIGDVVTVRNFEEMVREFGTVRNGVPDTGYIGFVDPMKEYCGKQIKINGLNPCVNAIRSMGWNWTAKMLEPYNEVIDEEQIQRDYMDMFFGGG